MKRNFTPVLLGAVLLFTLSGCRSVPNPADVPVELSIAELNQQGQKAFDASNYKAAEVYYQLIIDRYGTDLSALTGAEFEIAHLRVKQKSWEDAKTRLDTIITRYAVTGGATLPPEYLVLAKNDLARIPVSESKKKE